MLAACASVLLASCSTSDPDAPFGFAASGPSSLSASTGEFSRAGGAADAGEQVAADEFVMDDDDPRLPEAVAEAPTLRPVSATETAELARQEAAAPQQTAEAEQPRPVEEQGSTDRDIAADDAADAPAGQVAAFAPTEPKKRGFLSSLFGSQPARATPAPQAKQPQPPAASQAAATGDEAAPAAKPLIQLASTGPAPRPLVASAATPGGAGALPGVRQNALFEISRRSGLDDDSDIDLHEGEELYQVASAAGLARLAPNGLMKQTEHVDVACLKPSLVRVLTAVERNYGRKVVVTSGYRNPERNRKARGARNSLHMYCAAADVQVEGVSKWDLAQFVRTMPGRGGVGTYCHTKSVHIDVGPERDWNWRCRRRK